MSQKPPASDPLNRISPSKIVLPILLGLGVIAYLLYRDFDRQSFEAISWTGGTILSLLVTLVMTAGRHLGYMWRLRILSDKQLNWRQCFDVVSLWEFSSAVTPTQVGGTAVALYFLVKEKVQAGKGVAIILSTIFLDSTVMLTSTLFFWFLYGHSVLSPIFIENPSWSLFDGGVWVYTFLTAFILMTSYTSLIGYGLFFKPQGLQWSVKKVFTLPFLNRWREQAEKWGDDIALASKELQQKDFKFWASSFAATFIAWTSRFLVLNFLVWSVVSVGDHLLMFGRQFVLYLILMLTPTPGGSGFADFAFGEFFHDLIGNQGLASALGGIWRLLTYYPYLILGAVILPAWIKRKHGN